MAMNNFFLLFKNQELEKFNIFCKNIEALSYSEPDYFRVGQIKIDSNFHDILSNFEVYISLS